MGALSRLSPFSRREIQQMIDKSIAESLRKPSKKEETSAKQQVLILHYLGLLDSLTIETTKKALLISRLINRSEQNTREFLTYVSSVKIEFSDIKTEENLTTIQKLFQECGLTKEKRLVDKDLQALRKLK